MIGFSFRIMKRHVSFDSEMYFMRFNRNYVFIIHDEKVGLMRFDERNVRSLVKKMICVSKMV